MSDETQAIDSVREQVRKQMEVLTALDYGAPAELFPCTARTGGANSNTSDSTTPRKPFASPSKTYPHPLCSALILKSTRRGLGATKSSTSMKMQPIR